MPVTVDWANDSNVADYQPTGWNQHAVLAWRVYRGRGAVFGYVGETTTTQFIDYGDAPDLSRQPPQGAHPFQVKDYTGAVSRTETPQAVAYFEQRRIFANAASGSFRRSNTLWLSSTGLYSTFDMPFRPVPVASDAFEISLAGRTRQTIRSLVDAERLLVFTDAGVWSLTGPNNDALTAANLNLSTRITDVGANNVRPLQVNSHILYIRASGLAVQQLAPSNEARAAYSSSDASLLVRHLIGDEGSIYDWTYQDEPNRTVWAVGAGGRLLSCTYMPEFGVAAWAQHDTAGRSDIGNFGGFFSACTVREGNQDVVYAIVHRPGIRNAMFIERFFSGIPPDDVYPSEQFLDCAVYRGDLVDGQITDLMHLEGAEVYVVARNSDASTSIHGPYTVQAGSIQTDATEAQYALVGLRYFSEVELLDVAMARAEVKTRQKRVRQVSFEVQASRGLWTGERFDSLTEWRQRQVSHSYGGIPVFTGLVRVDIKGTWNTGGRAVLRQVDPLPLTVLAVTREVSLGGP
jgi:hypothetical protein